MTRETVYLVIRSDRTVRAAKRPRIGTDEVAFPIHLDYPNHWGKILTDSAVDIQVPDFTPEIDMPQPEPEAESNGEQPEPE